MNELTFTGNVSKVYEVRNTRSGEMIFSFDIVIEDGYFDKSKDKWVTRSTLFQPVVAYRELAANAQKTLVKGMTVTVTGKLLDDSFTPANSQYPVRRTKLEASNVSVSLRYATATVTKTSKTTGERGMEHNRELAAVA